MIEEEASLHDKALMQFSKIQSACRDQRKQSVEDRRFCTVPGAQWEGKLGEQYENKPKFEFNKINLSVKRIVNEYRNNKITVDFMTRDKGNSDITELCNSMYRADEQDSCAVEAYDNAFDEAVQGGIGAWRVISEYEDEYDEENEMQRIKIEPIYDADLSVFFDLDAKKQDKSDAKHCFLVSSMTPEAYKEEWDDEPSTWPTELAGGEFDWANNEAVYVAEYFVIEEKAETKVYYNTINGEEVHWLDDLKDGKEQDLLDSGYEEIRRRKVKSKKIHKYILSGGGILEDCGCIAGKEIPIVVVYGQRWYVENIERFMGHVRLPKDCQRLKNMQLSKLGEISSLSSVEKPIFTPEQIGPHQKMWVEDNIKNYPFLMVDQITNEEGQTVAQGPIAYTKPSSVPPALAALLQLTEADMKEILGSQEKGEQMMSHISGKAVELVQTRLDMQTYIYMSNFAKGMRRCGEIWLSMAKDIYIEDERNVRTRDSKGKYGSDKIRIRKIDETGEVYVQNDLDKAKFDVVSSVGPSSHSMREAIVRQVNGMMPYIKDPEAQQVLASTAIMNMEGEGTDDIREYFRKKLVKIGASAPTKTDLEEMEKSPDEPSPNDKYLLAEAKRAEAEASKNEANTVEIIANAELKKTQSMKIRADISKETMNGISGEDGKDEYKESEIIIKARTAAKELELKEREVDLKEREMELKESQYRVEMAKIGADLINSGVDTGDLDDERDIAENLADQMSDGIITNNITEND